MFNGGITMFMIIAPMVVLFIMWLGLGISLVIKPE